MRYFAWLLIKSILSSEQYHTQIEPYTYYKSLYVKKEKQQKYISEKSARKLIKRYTMNYDR